MVRKPSGQTPQQQGAQSQSVQNAGRDMSYGPRQPRKPATAQKPQSGGSGQSGGSDR